MPKLSSVRQDVRAPIVDPPASARDAYPICGLTYLLLAKQGKDAKKTEVVKNFVQYIITDGQASAEALSYAKLPAIAIHIHKERQRPAVSNHALSIR